MVDLASQPCDVLVKRQDIIKRQGIPQKYLDQIMMDLRKSSLVDSVRGRAGGYLLGRPALEITVWDVFAAVEDGFYPVRCVSDVSESSCHFESFCQTKEPWNFIFSSIRASLSSMNLFEVTAKTNNSKNFLDFFTNGPKTMECPSGNS